MNANRITDKKETIGELLVRKLIVDHVEHYYQQAFTRSARKRIEDERIIAEHPLSCTSDSCNAQNKPRDCF